MAEEPPAIALPGVTAPAAALPETFVTAPGASVDEPPSAPAALDDASERAPIEVANQAAPPLDAAGERLSADQQAILFTVPGSDYESDDNAEPVPAINDVPAVLYEDLVALSGQKAPPHWRRAGWATFTVLLTVVAALQVAFIARVPLLARVPMSAPAVDLLCERITCPERRQAAAAVRLLARDVREHPQYRDALLVNATIVTDAPTPSPYPVIDLRLRDAGGNVLSARQFRPAEYFDQSIPIDAGMPSTRPIYLVLELAGNAADAVSFEFTFL